MVRNLVRFSLYVVAFCVAQLFGINIAGGFLGAFLAAIVLAGCLHCAALLGKRILFSLLLQRGSINALLFYLCRSLGFVLFVAAYLSLATTLFPAAITVAGLYSQLTFAVLLLVASLIANLKLKEQKTISLGGTRVSKRDLRKRLGL